MKNQGKIAIVTGAAQGIGKACAARLHADGATVVVSDVQAEKAAEVAASLDSTGETAVAIPCEIGPRSAAQELVEATVARFGRLDIMVNNAAINAGSTVFEVDEEELSRVLGVNLFGTFWGTQVAAKQMVDQGGGAIVNMASAQSEFAIPTSVGYGVSKAAIQQMTRIFAVSLAQQGVRVNAVGPGTILTPMTVGLRDNEAAYRNILSRTPMGRLGGADEVASVVSFLASDDASYVTGQTIFPDGGRAYMNYTSPVPDPLPEIGEP